MGCHWLAPMHCVQCFARVWAPEGGCAHELGPQAGRGADFAPLRRGCLHVAERGRYFVHEHPASATSWSRPDVVRLRGMDDVTRATADMCMFGMKATDQRGQEGPVKKPTRWLSNAPALLRELGVRCNGEHDAHVHLLGGRAAAAMRCPPHLRVAIVRGIQAQREEDARQRARGEAPPVDKLVAAALREDMFQDHVEGESRPGRCAPDPRRKSTGNSTRSRSTTWG